MVLVLAVVTLGVNSGWGRGFYPPVSDTTLFFFFFPTETMPGLKENRMDPSWHLEVIKFVNSGRPTQSGLPKSRSGFWPSL